MGEGEKRKKFLSFSSLPFSLPSFPFSPETSDTQAIPIATARHNMKIRSNLNVGYSFLSTLTN